MTKQTVVQKAPMGMLIILFIGAFVAFLNNTLLNIALPTIMKDFEISYSTVQWISTGYMLVSGILIPASAFFITRFKTRTLYITALSIFTVGTVLAALSPNFGILLTGRMVQAAGASVMSPILMNVLLKSFPIEKRGAAMGVFGLVMFVAPAIGPTLSGWIIQNHDWRMLFEMIVPFAVISLLLSIWKLDNVLETRKVKLDYLSLVLSTVGFGGLLYGFSTAGDKGWSSPIVYGMIAIGAVGVTLFILRQLRMKEPMLEMRVYKYPMFALGSAISMILSMAMFAGMILTPAYVQNVRGITPLDAGLMMLPGAVVMAIMSPITGKMFDRFGPRILAIIGLVITAGATFFLTQLKIDSTYTYIIVVYTIRMFGMSLVMMPIMTNGLNQLPQRLNPHATAVNNTASQVAGSIGTALLVTIMNKHIATRATELAAAAKEKAMAAGAAMNADQVAALKAQITQKALLDGINYTFVVATGITVLALVLSFFLSRGKRAED